MAYSFQEFEVKAVKTEQWLIQELNSLRTGRAAPALLDSVRVDAYGNKLPLKQVASLAAEDARTLKLTVWDKSQIKAVERAINKADLDVTIQHDNASNSLRIIFSPLTQEKREKLMRAAAAAVERSKVVIRQERERIWSDIQQKNRSGELSEDEKFRLKNQLQELVGQINQRLDEHGARKEKEIMN